MKHERHDGKNEVFFKNLASSYAEQSGNELKKELEKLNSLRQSVQSPDISPYDTLDAKVRSRIRAEKIKRRTRILPIASCVIVLLAIVIGLPRFNLSNNSISKPPSKILMYEFINAELPTGYTLKKVDYDMQKAIYYISADNDGEIILTVEEFKGNINTDGLEEIRIGEINAYGISKEDYSFIQYKKDNFLYTLTSPRDYYDLIRISESLI